LSESFVKIALFFVELLKKISTTGKNDPPLPVQIGLIHGPFNPIHWVIEARRKSKYCWMVTYQEFLVWKFLYLCLFI